MTRAKFHVFARELAVVGMLVACAPRVGHAQGWKAGPIPVVAPSAEAVAEARSHKERADQLYREGSIGAALAEYQRAFEIAPHPVLLYNIGQIARSLPDYVVALRSYEAYLSAVGADVDAERRRAVEAEIGTLRGYVARIRVDVVGEGAEVSVDDERVGPAPLSDPLMVAAGRHTIVAVSGTRRQAQVVTVAGGETYVVSLNLGPDGPGVPVTPPPFGTTKPVSSPWTAPRWARWTMTGATAAMVVAAAVTGGLALKGSKDLGGRRFVDPAPGSVHSEASRVRSLGIASDVLIGTAAAGLAVTLYFWLAGPGDDVATDGTHPVAPTLPVKIFPGGIQLGMQF